MRKRTGKAEDFDWTDMRLWRFWFRSIEEADRAKKLFIRHFNPNFFEYIKRVGKEVRFKEACGMQSPHLGVTPAGPRLIRVHLNNVQFYATWFVHRVTVWDLMYDGKPRTTQKGDGHQMIHIDPIED